MGAEGRMSRRMQLRTLVLDRFDAAWTKAHLALYILDAIDTGDDSWLVLLNRMNIAVRRKNTTLFNQIVQLMKREVGWNHIDDTFIRNNSQ